MEISTTNKKTTLCSTVADRSEMIDATKERREEKKVTVLLFMCNVPRSRTSCCLTRWWFYWTGSTAPANTMRRRLWSVREAKRQLIRIQKRASVFIRWPTLSSAVRGTRTDADVCAYLIYEFSVVCIICRSYGFLVAVAAASECDAMLLHGRGARFVCASVLRVVPYIVWDMYEIQHVHVTEIIYYPVFVQHHRFSDAPDFGCFILF